MYAIFPAFFYNKNVLKIKKNAKQRNKHAVKKRKGVVFTSMTYIIGLIYDGMTNFHSAPHRNARIASAVLAIAIPSVCLSVCPSLCLSITRRYCVKTTARSTVQFALSDSKMCLVF